jgi:hypothetical protein
MAKLPKNMMLRLKNARAAANCEKSQFGMPADFVIYKGQKISVDEFVKEQIRVHHNSWVLHPIDEVIAWAENRDWLFL